jgi:hypothetical protein
LKERTTIGNISGDMQKEVFLGCVLGKLEVIDVKLKEVSCVPCKIREWMVETGSRQGKLERSTVANIGFPRLEAILKLFMQS